MTEIRTTSATGGQKGVKPQRYDLLPKEGLDAIAELFGYGAMKYADHNWRNGYEWSKGIAAMERHSQAHKNGETYDYCPPDCSMIDDEWCREHSRLEHLAAVGFHALVGLTWLRTQGEGADNPMDDRWPAAMERRRREAEAEEESDYVYGEVHPHGTTSDVPSGIGDLSHDVNLPEGWTDLGWTTDGGIFQQDEAYQFDGPTLARIYETIHSVRHGAPVFRFVAGIDPDEAADIVTGQRTNGVQRSFDLKD